MEVPTSVADNIFNQRTFFGNTNIQDLKLYIQILFINYLLTKLNNSPYIQFAIS